MADVRPLRALHYDLDAVGSLQDVVAPPYDVIDPGMRAELLARSPVCAQAFRAGPHLGVQFHPEVTAAVVEEWARSYPASIERAGTSATAVLADAQRLAPAAEAAATRLFDAFLAAAREHGRRVPSRSLG